MSASDMLDMCVQYIAYRHHMLTDEHVNILNHVWAMYEPLPTWPPPEIEEWNERVRQAKAAVAQAQEPFMLGQNPFMREFDPLLAVKHQVDNLVNAQQQLTEILDQQPRWQPLPRPTHQFFDQEEQQEEEQEEEQEYVPAVWELEAAARRREWEDAYGRMNESREKWEVLEEQRLQRQVGEPEFFRNDQEQEEEQEGESDEHIRQYGMNTARYLNPEDYAAEHQETCGCDPCEREDRHRAQETCDADRCTYECGAACGSSEAPEQVIDLTCEKSACNYGCVCDEAKNLLPPAEGCLYGCNYACGTGYGENCAAVFDADGNQVMPEDDMPPLVPLAAYATPRGWFNPEEDSEDEGPYAAPKRTGEDEGVAVPTVAPQPKPPKEKPLFPYNHPRWPSPRAKALVKRMIAIGETSLESIGSVLNKPIKSLNHQNCMQFLAKRYRLTPEQLLETSVSKLHNPPSATYWGTTQPCVCTFCRQELRGY
jgi:hypothetical protein